MFDPYIRPYKTSSGHVITVEPRPTHREGLKALSTIGKCLEDSNNPIARKLDTLLGTFNRQLRLKEIESMRSTLVTDFF